MAQMSVFIDHGPVSPEWQFEDVPRADWKLYVSVRRDFLHTKLTYDCRCLVKFIRDAERMWRPMGYESLDDFIRRGYELEPEEIKIAVRWLELNSPEDAIGIEQVVQIAAKQGEREAETVKQGTRTDLSELPVIHRKLQSGSGQAAYLARRIARMAQTDPKARDILERMKKGQFRSVRAAAIEAGIMKVPTRLEQIRKLWSKLTDKEKTVFLTWTRCQ